MKTIALLSGGKDSILAVLMAYRYGHEPAVIVNIVPALPGDHNDTAATAAATPLDASEVAQGHDIDSYMYQTVGFEAVEGIAACLGLPLRRACVKRGRAKDQSLLYSAQPPEEDEVESLYALLKSVKEEFPEVQGLTSGAILSNYQRNRVEFICDRLGIESLAYLWMRQPIEILDMAHNLAVRAILVKTASIGLLPRQLIGKTLEEARPTLEKMTALYQSHLAGEGGEYETTVLNCPLFQTEQLSVTSLEVVMQDDNDISPSGHGLLTIAREAKTAAQQAEDATLLQRLRAGTFRFPSDVMPLLASLPSTVTALPPLPPAQTNSEAAKAVAHASGVFMTSGRLREGIEGHHCTASIAPPSIAAAEMQAVVASQLAELNSWAAARALTPFYYHLSLPTSKWEAPARAAYTAAVPHVCPPGLLLTIDSDVDAHAEASSVALVAEVLAAPLAHIGQNVLHAQSRSCWALGEPGPYAQARRVGVKPDGRALLFVSATPGRVPASRELAAVGDLPNTARAGLLTFLNNSVEAAQLEAAGRFAAQFLFAMANCAQYLALFKRTLADVRRATLVVTRDAPYAAVLPTLWQWCVQGKSASSSFAHVCAAIVVPSLPAGELVRVSVECVEMGCEK